MTNRKEGSGIRAGRSAREWTMKMVKDRCEEIGDCQLWKLSVNSTGYPSVSYKGKTKTVRKLVYEDLLGKEIKAGRRITTKCHNPLCVSEHCLVQMPTASIIQSAHDRRRQSDPMSILRDQRAASHAKLSPEIAVQVRASEDSHEDWAKRLGVHVDSIRAIRRGDSYAEPVRAANSVFSFAGTL